MVSKHSINSIDSVDRYRCAGNAGLCFLPYLPHAALGYPKLLLPSVRTAPKRVERLEIAVPTREVFSSDAFMLPTDVLTVQAIRSKSNFF